MLVFPRRISEFQAFSLGKSDFKISEKVFWTHRKFSKKNITAKYIQTKVKIQEYSKHKMNCPVCNAENIYVHFLLLLLEV